MANPSAEEIKGEWIRSRKQLQAVSIAALTLLSIGTIFFHFVEKLSWVDALYFCTVTLTTVGYGDIIPKTDAAKIFTVFYLLIGIGLIASFANLLFKSSSLRREYRRASRRSAR